MANDQAEPRRRCGWCNTGHHTLCLKTTHPDLPCGCTERPGLCGGDTL